MPILSNLLDNHKQNSVCLGDIEMLSSTSENTACLLIN